MNVQDVGTLLSYNRWANERLLDAASRLPAADFTRDLGASFGSVRGTLLHILWGERRWLQFWQEGSFMPEPSVETFPDAAALAAAWSSLDRDRETFAASLTDERLSTFIAVRDQTYTLAELFQHILNHSTYHRGQVALLLRQLGHGPPATDYRHFLSETRKRLPNER